jgi:hypothetical protein
MPWKPAAPSQFEGEVDKLKTVICGLRHELTNKEGCAAGLEMLLRQRNERIDQLTAQVDQLRQHSRHADEGSEYMAMFVGLMLDLDDAVAAKQSMACVTG